jgi:glycosyltransferase involved in cell wall biosynthesis
MVLHASPSPGELGPGRRHRHLLRQLLRRHDVSVLSFGNPVDRDRFSEEFGAQCRRAVFVSMRRTRVHDALIRFAVLLIGRSEFRRLYRRRFQRALDTMIASQRFDLVIFSTTLLGCYRVPSGIRTVGDTHNVEYDNLQRAAVAARGVLRRLYFAVQAALTAREERRYNRQFSAIWATSPRDAALIRSQGDIGPVRVVPNGVDLAQYQVTRRPAAANLLYTGLMSYYPNWHGIQWFIEEVLPLIETEFPDVTLTVVGADPPRALRRAVRPNLDVTGYVRSVQPYFERATVFVVPLAIGGGTRVKVLEALACGVPVVSTTVGCEGIDVVDGESVLLADGPSTFARAVLRLLRDQALARLLAEQGRGVARRYDWNVIGRRLDDFCSEMMTWPALVGDTRMRPSYFPGTEAES